MKYMCIRWDSEFNKYAVTEEEGEPKPLNIHRWETYWFPTKDAAIKFAEAQKLEVRMI